MTEHTPVIQCDTNRCVGCHACEAACKAFNQLKPGVSYRWVAEFWEGDYPQPKLYTESIGCYHCEDAPCAQTCPTGAITRDPHSRAVIVDKDRCDGNQACFAACPYEIPRFDHRGKISKCDLCIDKVTDKEIPICVKTCPSGALSIHR